MRDFLHSLLVRLDQQEELILTAEDFDRWEPGSLDWLLRTGVLIACQPATERRCPHCPEHSSEAVVYLDGAAGTEPLPYLACPQCGPVRLEPHHLGRWNVNLGRLWETVFERLEMALHVQERIPARLWRLGRWRCDEADWEIMIGRLLWRPSSEHCIAKFRFAPRTVLFVPARIPERGRSLPDSVRVISLRDVLSWVDNRLVFDNTQIASHLESAPVTASVRPKRPPQRRAERAATIERLVRLLKEHVQAAREYARTTAEHGAAELLPRPTQRELAQMAEVPEMTVSRCLRDPAARELKLLWELAGDLDRLLTIPAGRNR